MIRLTLTKDRLFDRPGNYRFASAFSLVGPMSAAP